MDRARGELDLLGDDELEALRRANGDLELGLGLGAGRARTA